MAGTTSKGLRYQDVGDAPNGAAASKNLADDVNGHLVRYDTGYAVHIRTVAGSANFVKPTNPPARVHWVRCWGPAAAGGGVIGAGSGQGEGGGGGAGGYTEKWYNDADLAASEPYVVGAGGSGVSGANGNNGSGPTTFKGLSAGPGTGGQVMTSTTGNAGAQRGAGGTATGGDLNSPGGDGGAGRVLGGQAVFGGRGGASPGGGGETQFPTFGAGAGAAGDSPGGAGSGAFGSTTSQAGGGGADGKILIVSFY
ncbi:hypothetical protein PWY87_34075 [Kribbella solani]|uniref:hypothetical protein n=1 Tax=Kribbella solani TaxID=236067 RepID=UPI0029B518AA|nr:hypothetical protein [Kribbella solani]MDX3006745.1 hypothetical protein [Kribbella solani]